MKWISVTDSLPNNDREVLIYIKYDDIPTQAYWSGDCWFASIQVTDSMRECDVVSRRILDQRLVLFWMELPEIPNCSAEL